jgi:hypothetical protein
LALAVQVAVQIVGIHIRLDQGQRYIGGFCPVDIACLDFISADIHLANRNPGLAAQVLGGTLN